jgi:hypothetical protein
VVYLRTEKVEQLLPSTAPVIEPARGGGALRPTIW